MVRRTMEVYQQVLSMIEASLALLFGLLIGSFLNVCIYRWPRDLSVVRPRSHCPHCEKTIAWYDNMPLVSYAMLGGRCRHCKQRISVRYPIVELMTAALFFYFVYAQGVTALAHQDVRVEGAAGGAAVLGSGRAHPAG